MACSEIQSAASYLINKIQGHTKVTFSKWRKTECLYGNIEFIYCRNQSKQSFAVDVSSLPVMMDMLTLSLSRAFNSAV